MRIKHRKVPRRLQLLEQAATEQLNSLRGAEHELVEAQKRIAQLDQALQQGGRLAMSVSQAVDTRVLGRPDTWDGNEKAWPNWSFMMKAYAGAIDQELSTDMTGAEVTRQRRQDASQEVQECAANAPHGRRIEAWRMLFQAYSPKNNARWL